MAEELSKVYEPRETERQANEIWLRGNCFSASADGNAEKSYCIVIPPPNVTAPLHLGHALNNTLQDILIRFKRMQGFNTLWMPGTDHAGIATQTVVEKRILAEENRRRTDFERDEFVARVQAWKDEYEACIIGQLKAMGCSCDWDRTRFTMDEVCAKAVRAAFFKLFKDGLIYRGKRLVNWDPATQTVLADDEVEHETIQGHFWYLRYPLAGPVVIEGNTVEHVTVATTRPETMLGDTAVAMNPADERAKYLIGKNVRLPIVERIIPIIGDEHVVLPDTNGEDEKARFSTGFLKVTPAHDPDDWEIGQRHNLPVINVMAPDGSISDKYGWEDVGADAEFLLGMDRYEAREAIVEWFRTENLLEDVREYAHEVGHSYRSHVPIEPYLSDQWYIAVKKPIPSLVTRGSSLVEGTDIPLNSLAGLALAPLLDGRLRFIPERYAKTYRAWLENLRDWPISRQLWWGHRIPVWHIVDESKIWASNFNLVPGYERFREVGLRLLNESRIALYNRTQLKPGQFDVLGQSQLSQSYICVRDAEDQEAISLLQEFGWGQDEDVLDTWFSSALWPFSTMGWPDETGELKTFYPGDVLCTAREIITLWVSRMVMMGQYCVGDIPFSDVYIHAMIQDGEGRKMSKSLGNGIDPLVAIDSHGADAMRFTLASMTTETQDVRMPVVEMELPDGRKANTSPKFDIGRNFCNKLWNASRFALMNLEGTDTEAFNRDKMTVVDRWILSRLARAIERTNECLESYKFSEPINELYKFFWNDVCDWYLEWAKPRMQDGEQKAIAQNVLAFVLDAVVRLLHPFIPFITEGIFQKLNEVVPERKLNGLAEAGCSKALVCAVWPGRLDGLVDEKAEGEIALVQSVIKVIRDIRTKYSKPPREMLSVSVKVEQEQAEILNRSAELVRQLAAVNKFEAGPGVARSANAAIGIAEGIEVYVHDVIDIEAELKRLTEQKQQTLKAKTAVEVKLANENFVNKAKREVVEQAKQRQTELGEQLAAIERHLAELESGR
jgi:valyl-tRNA synthetase